MKKKILSYLDHLTFNPRLATTMIAKYLTNTRLVMLLVIGILVFGFASFSTLPRRLNPEIKIPIVSVVTMLPGAGPDDIEQLVTVPLEDAVDGLEGIDTVSSVSQDNLSIVTLEFSSRVDPDDAESDVQEAVNTVTDLPDDAQDPRVAKLDFENQPILTFVLTSSSDEASLMRFSKELEDRIQALSSVKSIDVQGRFEQEIQVLIQPEKLATYGISPFTLSQAITDATASFPAGSITTDSSAFSLTVDPTIATIDDIRNFDISINNQTIALGDIATVAEVARPNQKQALYADGNTTPQSAVRFSVFKTSSADIDESSAATRSVIDELLADYGNQFSVSVVLDSADEVTEQFDELISNFRSSIGLVFLTLFIFLGIRQALIVSLSIPLTFLVAFTVMRATGITINFLSLFSLLLALGLLVDDAIVIVSAMTSYYRTNKFTPNQTGLLVWKDFIVPIWSTTITTVWAFVPLLLSTGIIGEFIKSIPIVVSATLIASTSIAVLVTLPVMMTVFGLTIPRRVKVALGAVATLILIGIFAALTRGNPLFPIALAVYISLLALTYSFRKRIGSKSFQLLSQYMNVKKRSKQFSNLLENGLIDFEKISNRYEDAMEHILESKIARRKVIFAVLAFSLFSYLLVPFGFVVNEFFPGSDEDQLFVQIELPPGTNRHTAALEARDVLGDLRQVSDIDFILAEPGSGFNGDGGGGLSVTGENKILLSMVLLPGKERDQSSIVLAQSLRDQYANYSAGKFSVIEVSGGPPAGSDVQIKFLGDDLTFLDEFSEQTVQYLDSQDGVINTSKSISAGTSKLVFIPDTRSLSENGITIGSLGIQLRAFASGFELDTIKLDGDDQDIVFRMDSDLLSPENIGQVTIPTRTGTSIPLLELGSLQLRPNPTLITREDGKRTISVSAGVTEGFSISAINSELETFADTISLPAGYEWKTGGVNEENQRSVQSIVMAMGLSAILIMATMVIQLGSYRKALIVLLVIPLAISGVFVIFALTGTPLSFPALIGVLALFGIVVNNSIVIVEKINQNLAIGMELQHAISDAAGGRVEPIFFSSLTTLIGLLPITISNPLWRGLGGAIISGLAFSGTIMLFFIPVTYYAWFRGEYERNTNRPVTVSSRRKIQR